MSRSAVATAPAGSSKPYASSVVVVTQGTDVRNTRTACTVMVPSTSAGESASRVRWKRSDVTDCQEAGGPTYVTPSPCKGAEMVVRHGPVGLAEPAAGLYAARGSVTWIPSSVDASTTSRRDRLIQGLGKVTSSSTTAFGMHSHDAS